MQNFGGVSVFLVSLVFIVFPWLWCLSCLGLVSFLELLKLLVPGVMARYVPGPSHWCSSVPGPSHWYTSVPGVPEYLVQVTGIPLSLVYLSTRSKSLVFWCPWYPWSKSLVSVCPWSKSQWLVSPPDTKASAAVVVSQAKPSNAATRDKMKRLKRTRKETYYTYCNH